MKSFKNFEGKVLSKKEQMGVLGGTVCGFGRCVTKGSDGIYTITLMNYQHPSYLSVLEKQRYTFV